MYTPINIKRNTWYGSNYWESYSNKVGRIVRFFSELEYEHWILLEANPKVKTFCEQPLRIKCLYEGEKVESIFDMWVYYHDGYEEFLEVKYSKELDPNNPKAKRSIRQTTIQKYWCKENDKNYRIIKDSEVRSNMIYLSNLKQILYFTKIQNENIGIDYWNEVLEKISKEQIQIIDILNSIVTIPKDKVLRTIYSMILDNKIRSDIQDKILSYETGVWLHE